MYTAAIFNDIISIIVHLLLWMYVMLDFICTCFAELWGTGREQNMQNETLCLKQDSNPTLEKLTKGKPVPLDHLSHSTIHVFSNYHCTSVKTVAVSESKAIGTPAP